MTADERASEEQAWEVGWDGHELAQMRRMAKLSLREKIAWLEEAQRLVQQLSAARERRNNPGETPPGVE